MNKNIDIHQQVLAIAIAAKKAAHHMSIASDTMKNDALYAIASALRQQTDIIQTANQKDITFAKEKEVNAAFIDRLTLNADRIGMMAKSLEDISQLKDPVGKKLATFDRPNGLHIDRVSVPIGVIAVIYESRPNVTSDAAGLCIKSGNAVILRGGSESFHAASAIMSAISQGLQQAGLPTTAVQMIPTTDRAAVKTILSLDQYIDVIIPRGGPKLIESIAAESRIPLFKHLAGICHTYVHQDADLTMARKIILNAKLRRTGICGATEVLLIDSTIAKSYLPSILNDLIAAGCEIRGDKETMQLDPRVKAAQLNDYHTEFLDAILAVKVIKDLNEAISHINQYGTQHTEAIITHNKNAAETFMKEINSAIVMHNASTQFADGGEFGMGAEIGIATGKLHARGPVGVEQLTTFKYCVIGKGQIRT